MTKYRLCNHPDEDHEWQDAMRARENRPVQSDYSTEGNGGSPIPSLQRMLTLLYEAEVDFAIHSAWDCGFRFSVHAPRGEGWTDRGFTVGKAPHDFPTWAAAWDAVVFFICETVVRDWANLEDGVPVDVGCLECTLGTTPNKFNKGLCVYHVAEHVLNAHGLRKVET